MKSQVIATLLAILFIFVIVGLTAPIVAQEEKKDKQEEKKEKMKFNHPSIIVTKDDIKRIKDAIKRGAEPQKTGFDELMQVAQQHMQGEPKPLEKMFIPFYYANKERHMASRGSLDNDCDAILALGLAYSLTDDKRYADKSLQYIKAWVKTCKIEKPDEDTPLIACRSLTLMLYGADLLWNYKGFNNTDKEAFLKWSKGTVYDMGADIIYTKRAANNWGANAIMGMMAYAIVSEDEEKFNELVNLWKKHLPGNLNKNAEFQFELKRHDGSTGRGISYSQFAQHAYTLTALMCLNQGIDLFSYKTPDGVGLKDSADKLFGWEMKPGSFPYDKDYKQLRNRFHATWEVLYKQYKVKEWGNKIIELRKTHEYTWNNNEGAKWLTLTHGLPK